VSLRLVVSPANRVAPFAPEAVVIEDDTFGVLGAEPLARERYEDVGRLAERAADADPDAPGSVRVREGAPLAFHAIVHDLEREPTWREEWVLEVLQQIFAEAARRRLKTLSLPVLGSIHGSLEARRFAQLLRLALLSEAPTELERVWLVTAPGVPGAAFDPLREFELEVRS
jgi:hypothetical protein